MLTHRLLHGILFVLTGQGWKRVWWTTDDLQKRLPPFWLQQDLVVYRVETSGTENR